MTRELAIKLLKYSPTNGTEQGKGYRPKKGPLGVFGTAEPA